jgi:hypothetical protein
MRAYRHASLPGIVLLLLLGALMHTKAAAQQLTQRLILKDGSYQSVQKYEVQGDRVHYLSAERYEWEDIPASLVDWDATKKYNDSLTSGKMHTRLVETPEEREQHEKEAANSPEVAPGLNLPGSGGVFMLDQFEGKPELAEVLQNGSEVNKTAAKKSVLHSPFGGDKKDFEIKGEHAQIQSHVPKPTIYIDIDEGQHSADALSDRFRLVRLTARKDARVVGNVKVSVAGKVTQQTSFVPAHVVKQGTGNWIELTPTQNLAVGEYAVVEMLSPQEMNLYVWDFGVNPNAPLNPNTWRPVSAK